MNLYKVGALIICASIALLTGCVPYSTYYFQPNANEGTKMGGACGNPPDTMEFSLSATARIKVSAHHSDENNTSLVIEFWVKPDNKLRITPEYLTIRTPDGDIILQQEIKILTANYFSIDRHPGQTKIISSEDVTAADTDVTTGKKLKPTQESVFYTSIKLEHKELKKFSVEFPPIQLNGIEHQLPTMKFEYKKYQGIEPLMC